MPNYQYIARTAGGEEVTGIMMADNELAVVRSLDERKLFPVSVTAGASSNSAFRGGGVRLGDMGVMYGQLSDLLKAGVPMLKSLDTLVKAVSNRRLSAVMASVRDQVAEGKTLADAMAANPKVFTSLHVAMVRAGERAGFLEDVLQNLAQFLERQDEFRGKVRGAMIYPVVLLALGGLIMTGVLLILVPRFRGFFKGDLPLPTTILFAISDALQSHFWLVLGLTVMAVVGIRALLKSQAGQRKWDRWKLKVPLVGTPIRMLAVTRFCRILGTMLANGVPILQSLGLSKDAAGSIVLAESIEQAAESVRAGESLAEPLRACGLFPPEVLAMISVAEESNQLEKVLVQIADTVERRTNRHLDQAVRLIEPLILVVLAVMIGFVAVGLLYPIFTMSQAMSH